jgi:predicted RNA polymerase sigma factor
MAVAKQRAIDLFRRSRLIGRKHEQLGYELQIDEAAQPDLDAALDDHIRDDLLRLIFISCHPILSPEARAALTLRLLGGLTVPEIARAFLMTARLRSTTGDGAIVASTS